MQALRRRGGFTLIELLVVILILAILLAIGLPLYLRAVADSERRTCETNMQTIATAVQAYRVHHPDHEYPADLTVLTEPLSGETTADLQEVPLCPNGGDYSITYDPEGSDPALPSGDADTPAVSGFHLTCTVHGDFYPSGVGTAPTP